MNSGVARTDDLGEMAGDDLASDLTEDLRARVKGELEPGERLLWAGRNRNERRVIRHGHLTTALFATGFFLLTFVCLWWFNNREHAVVLGLLSGLVGFCVVVGLVGSIYNSLVNHVRERTTMYALTDRRFVVWLPESFSLGVAVHSIPRGQVKHVHRVEFPDGSGTLKFTLVDPLAELPTTDFTGISEVRRVEQIVRNNLITDEKPAQADSRSAGRNGGRECR